jgi:putative hydrolase of the HAD superfamily
VKNVNYKSINLIAFDLGYTLVFNHREDYYMRYLEKVGVNRSKDEVEAAFHKADKTFMRYYIGVLGKPAETYLPWYLGNITYHLNLKLNLIELTEYFMAQNDNSAPYWDAFHWTKHVLESLKQKGYQVALLSNWDLNCRKILKQLNLYDYFDYILVSSEVDVEKPDPRIFQLLIEESGYKPEEILYVGDNYYDDVVGSRKVGINSVLINRFDSFGIEEINDCQVITSTKELLTLLKEKDSNFFKSSIGR